VLRAALLLVLSTAAPQTAPPPDTVRLAAREAQRAAVRYERILLTTSPRRFGSLYGDRCDEQIGRFCFWFSTPGTPRRPIDPEAPEVAAVRDDAIHTYRRWFALAPHDGTAVGALVRYLIESDRAAEAVAAARSHVWAAGESPESLLFLGLALHYAQDFLGAEDAFDRARVSFSERERRKLDDIGVLLESADYSRYRRLPDEERVHYEAMFWAFSDPWLMEPGNERRSAHYARHAWNRILARAPRVEGRMRWGSDHDEILLRYGLPTGRQRIYATMSSVERRMSLVEWFDPRRVALTPGDLLTGGIPYTPPAGVRPEIERDTVRSHYAPLGLRRTRGLVVQPSVFPGPDGGAVRVDALLAPDSTDPKVPLHPRGILVLLDTLGREIDRAPVTPRLRPDSSTVLSAERKVPPGTYVYRIEIRDDSTGLAGLAQYRIDVAATTGLTLSDLLVAAPGSGQPPESRADSTLEAIPGLVLPPGAEVAVYAEVSGLSMGESGASFGVQWWLERADDDGLLRRAARWVGERVGLLSAEQPTRVAWEEFGPEQVHAIFVTLSLADADPGLHRLGLLVRDRISGEEQTSSRLVRIDRDAPRLPRRAGN
jgi:hypothetical protein